MSDKKKSVGSFQDLQRLLENEDVAPKPVEPVQRGKRSPYQGLDVYYSRPGMLSLNHERREKKERSLREREALLKKWEQGLEQREHKYKFYVGRLTKGKENLAHRRKLFVEELNELRQLRQHAEQYESKLAELKKDVEELNARRARLGEIEAQIKLHKDRASWARNEAKALTAELEKTKKELTSAKRSNTALVKARDKLKDQQTRSGWFAGCIEWALDNGRRNANQFSQGVVILGSGPIDETDLTNFFIDRGIDVYETDAEGVECMIVGRESWTEEQLEMQVAAQQGQTLKVYSQEMAIMCLLSGSDIFEVEDETFLENQADDHPALAFLKEGELQWPLTLVPTVPKVFKPLHEDRFGVDQSPLKILGYAAGRTENLSASERQKILTEAYLGPLKRVHSDEYMRDWGQPRTRRRLWRIANHLAWQLRSKRNIDSMELAVDHWVSDLQELEKKFFKPWMRFAWPEVKVPGSRRRK